MADVNWHKHSCDICRAIGLTAAAVVTGVAVAGMHGQGMPILPLFVLAVVIAVALFLFVEHHCQQRTLNAEKAAAAVVADPGATAAVADATATADAKIATRAAEQAKEAAMAVAPEVPDPGASVETGEAAAEVDTAIETEVAKEVAAEVPDAGATVEAAEEAAEVDAEIAGEGTRPEALDAPRGGKADDLKLIKGVGPKLEEVCNGLGFWHFDQIAAWTDAEVAWVDQNLEGFKGRVTRDDWVAQAKILAAGGETEFSKRQ